jgi:hypothetical protein
MLGISILSINLKQTRPTPLGNKHAVREVVNDR